MSNLIGQREFAKPVNDLNAWARMMEDCQREVDKAAPKKCGELLHWDNPYEGCDVCFRKKNHAGNHYDPYTGCRWNETEVNQIDMFEQLAEDRYLEAKEHRRRYPKLRVVK